ncbi:hypothetical protein JHK86_016522 [Glycine max]|nr:hypothetical protein JHK86_016522 [Glycine max]
MTTVASLSFVVENLGLKVLQNKGPEVRLSGSAAKGKPPTTLLLVDWRCMTGHVKHVQSIDNGTCVDNMVALDMGENNIISDILSLELDAWEGSLVNLLGKRDELYRSFKAATLQKFQDKNQSRLSFVR